jgi:hypothetical protein
MYKNLLLTGQEIEILMGLIRSYLRDKNSTERNNLTIILNRLRNIKPTKISAESIN